MVKEISDKYVVKNDLTLLSAIDRYIAFAPQIKNKKTGEVYKTEEALKAANIPEEDVQRDVTVIMPALDLFAKTK